MSRQKGWTADKICKELFDSEEEELDMERFSEGIVCNRMQNAEQHFDHGRCE